MREYYIVRFTNALGSDIGRDITWSVTVSAESEADALQQGLADARDLNQQFGFPPHGIKVSDDELQKLVSVHAMLYA